MVALGCSDSGSSSSGCGGSSSERCEINATATVCGDRITVECFEGATPDAIGQCVLALQQAEEAIYCCTSAAGDMDGSGPGVGAGGAGGAGAGAGGAGEGGGGSGGASA
jgi:hypothetical protein